MAGAVRATTVSAVTVGSVLRLAAVAGGVVVASWAVLIILAARLPDGLLKDLARFIPDCIIAVRRLRRDPRVPRRTKLVVGLAAVWVISPIDLIPEFVPVIGPLDDIVVVGLALRYAARSVPREVLVEAWPGRPEVIDRLVGRKPVDGDPAPS